MDIQEIDTRHGTANHRNFSHGNCLPYTGVPFGMNYFAPQTNEDERWWFHPQDQTFLGYRLTHQPSPWMGDYSHLLLNPVSGTFQELSLFHAQSSYRPAESIFQPVQLQITQQRYQISSCLIPSLYGAVLTIDYTQSDNGLLLQLPGRFQVTSSSDGCSLQGWLINYAGCEDPDFKMYFSCRLQRPLQAAVDEEGTDGLLHLKFGSVKQQMIQLATSFISPAQAALNLEREQSWTATDYLTQGCDLWQSYFKRITLQHHDRGQVKTFYQNLYRLFLFPQTFYELDATGQAVHYDTLSRQVRSGMLFTNNGFWDTYKTVYPLFSLIAQEKYEEFLIGFLNSYRETGYLPKWLSPDERGLMPGTLIDAVIADAAVKGLGQELLPEFLTAMKKAAALPSSRPNYGRQGAGDYQQYGYVPSHYHESVNHTLDYAYSDFCISQVAHVLQQTADVTSYQQSALNYRKLFDSETGFMRAKDTAGLFRPAFSPVRWGQDYAEGSAWQSSFAVYQDFAGLIQLFGGTEAFAEQLISLCNQTPQFAVDGYGFEIHEMSEMAAVEAVDDTML